jgi:hypothetical protein
MKRFLKALAKILISAAAIYYVFTKIEIEDVLNILKSVNYFYLVIATILFAFSKVLSAYRLNYYFKPLDVELHTKSNLKLYLLGMYYNLFLPGGIGGDGYKVWILNKKYSTPVKHLFWAVLLDRINGMYVLLLIALLMTPLLDISITWIIISYIFIPLSILIYLLINKKFFNRFYQTIIQASAYSFGVQILQLLSAMFILFANDSFDGLTSYLFLFLISSIVAALPITIGGIGSREITFLFGAQVLNLDINLSIALSLLFYIITLVVSFFGIYYSLNPKALDLKIKVQPDIN